MGLVYFSIPLLVGKFVYDAVVRISEDKWKVDPVTGKTRLPPQVAARAAETKRIADLANQSVSQLLDQAAVNIEQEKKSLASGG